MDVKQAQLERDMLEQRIRDFVADQLESFEQETGISIERVDIDMLEFGVVGEKRRKYIVQGVSCRIAF